MAKEISLYVTEELPLTMKFYVLMDLLISNQVESRIEIFVFLGIFYLQILSVFFSDHVGILDPKNSYSDKILNYIEKIVRIKDLFTNSYNGSKILLLILFVLIMFTNDFNIFSKSINQFPFLFITILNLWLR